MRINHNISSLRALHQLDKSNSSLDKTLERLSSGLRINHAADDAAGLAITQKMDTQVRGLEQANRNAMDGISLIQTAEGALNEVHSMLQRIRELAVQVSNGTYDAQDRKAVQDEVTQLQEEIERISSSVEFNEVTLLNGDIDRRAFSTAADVADIVSMSDTVDAGVYTFEVAQLASTTGDVGGIVDLFDGDGEATIEGTININGEQVDIEIGDTTDEVFSQLRELASKVGVSITIEPSAPFGNGKSLSLSIDQSGPKSLDVTGDLELLEAIGLDEGHFQPNTNEVYQTEVDFSGGVTAADADVLINGTTISIASGDTNEEIYEKLESASIQGLELSYSSTGAVVIFSNKALVIEPANPSDTDDIALADELVASGLSGGTALTPNGTADLTKSIPEAAITTDGSTGDELTGEVAIFVDGVSVGTIDWTGGLDLDDSTDLETALTNLNAVDAGDTIFSFTDEDPAKLVAYNKNGYEVTIKPVSNVTAADITTVSNLGYASGEISVEKGFGNLGRNVQIDSSSIIYDDPLTNEIDGFPAGTTVTTAGSDIIFESNDNFELRLVSGDSIGGVTMNLLETGPLDLQIGANEGQFMEIRIQNLSPRAIGITDLNLSTSDGAQEAITIVDTAIETISTVRSKLGAYQNRLEHTIANLETASENMTASLSRILDADMAYEMSQFTLQNVIQQAGTSMLAQANQRPQSLLQLLQG